MTGDTVESLARLVGGTVQGDGDRAIVGVADLRLGAPDRIGFLNDPKYADAAASTTLGALLVRDPIATPASQVVVRNVYAAFAKIALHFHPVPRATEHAVHPTAYVDPSAQLQEPVRVGPNAVIEAGARVGPGTVISSGVQIGEHCVLGADCVLFPGVVLYPGVSLGDRVILHGNCVIGSDGFGYAREDDGSYVKLPQLGTVSIEADVEIGANAAIDRATLGVTRIGRGTKLDNLIQVGHNCEFGEHVAVAGFSAFSGSTVLGDRVAMGGHSVSAGHLKIASDVRVGGNSVVHKDLKDAGDYLGYPLQEKRRWVRTMGAIDRLIELQGDVRALKKRTE